MGIFIGEADLLGSVEGESMIWIIRGSGYLLLGELLILFFSL